MSESFVGTLRRVLSKKPRKNSPIQYGGRYGHAIYHMIISLFGVWPAYLMLTFVIPWFSLIRSSARKLDYFYLERRFPGQNFLMRFIRSAKHLTYFALVLIDQAAAGILGKEKVQIEFPNPERLYDLSRSDRGLVLITAHVGNFLGSIITTHYLDVPIHVVLDTKNYKGNHFFELSGEHAGFQIIPPTLQGMVTATHALTAGEIVVIMGDRKDQTRSIELDFLGKKARFPAAPYHLAVSTGANVAILLTARTGILKFRFEFETIRINQQWQDLNKEEAMRKMAEKYVHTLETYVARFPYMWYNFYNSWE